MWSVWPLIIAMLQSKYLSSNYSVQPDLLSKNLFDKDNSDQVGTQISFLVVRHLSITLDHIFPIFE